MMRLSSSRVIARSFSSRPLVATEEFPFKVTLTPSKPTPAVTKESKLPCGVKVITRENSNSPMVNIKVAILGGSGSETWAQKGSAHFLAAAAYSGNHKNSGIRIVRYLESLGATIKSTADKEQIIFDMNVMADKVDAAFSGLATAVSTPPQAQYVFDEEVKKIAHVHYDRHHHDIEAQLIELLHEAAYGETAPLGAPLFAQNVDRLNYDEVISYRKNHFVAGNIVVAASGISHEKMSALVEQHVEGGKTPSSASVMGIELGVTPIATANKDAVAPWSAQSPYVGGVAKLRLDVDGESHIGLGFPVPTGEAAKPYLVLHRLLADKFSSGSTFIRNYSRGGLIGFYTSGDAATAGANVEAVIAELKAVASGAVDMTVAKNKVALDHFLGLEGSNAASTLLVAHANGVSAESFGDVRGVSKEDVVAAAQTALKSDPSYAVLGTTAFTPSFANILKLWK